MNYEEAIKGRRSIRKYNKKELSKNELNSIKKEIKQTNTVLGTEIKTKIVKKEIIDEFVKGIIGNYGKIESPYYLVISNDGRKKELIDTGFFGEKIILDLTKKKLGTCWIGKIGKKEDLAKNLGLSNPPVALIAFGEPQEKVYRSKEPSRKNLKKLILEGNPSESYKKILELVRYAPSAVNQQPWRFIVKENQIDFYLTNKGIFKKLLTRISNLKKLNYIDMGIALRHAELGIKEQEKEPEFFEQNVTNSRKMEYILSVKKTNN